MVNRVYQVTVEWDAAGGDFQRERRAATVYSAEALDALLDRLHEEASPSSGPFVATVVARNDARLTIGLGRDETVLTYDGPNADPPYYRSKGNPNATGTISFFLTGHRSEFPRSSAIPMGAARGVVRVFAATGRLPDQVHWEEV